MHLVFGVPATYLKLLEIMLYRTKQ